MNISELIARLLGHLVRTVAHVSKELLFAKGPSVAKFTFTSLAHRPSLFEALAIRSAKEEQAYVSDLREVQLRHKDVIRTCDKEGVCARPCPACGRRFHQTFEIL